MTGLWLIFTIIGCIVIGWLSGVIWCKDREWSQGYQDGYSDRDAEYDAVMARIRLHQAKREERGMTDQSVVDAIFEAGRLFERERIVEEQG